MAQEPLPNTGGTQWLWLLLIGSLGLLLVMWVIANWQIDSDVTPGAGPDGLTFPANAGHEVVGTRPGEEPSR